MSVHPVEPLSDRSPTPHRTAEMACPFPPGELRKVDHEPEISHSAATHTGPPSGIVFRFLTTQARIAARQHGNAVTDRAADDLLPLRWHGAWMEIAAARTSSAASFVGCLPLA